jgi:hypothetical protein
MTWAVRKVPRQITKSANRGSPTCPMRDRRFDISSKVEVHTAFQCPEAIEEMADRFRLEHASLKNRIIETAPILVVTNDYLRLVKRNEVVLHLDMPMEVYHAHKKAAHAAIDILISFIPIIDVELNANDKGILEKEKERVEIALHETENLPVYLHMFYSNMLQARLKLIQKGIVQNRITSEDIATYRKDIEDYERNNINNAVKHQYCVLTDSWNQFQSLIEIQDLQDIIVSVNGSSQAQKDSVLTQFFSDLLDSSRVVYIGDTDDLSEIIDLTAGKWADRLLSWIRYGDFHTIESDILGNSFRTLIQSKRNRE